MHTPVDGLADLLEMQCGVVSRAQAVRHGFSADAIERRLASGVWQRLHRAVYAAFSGEVPFHARVWAAVLRAGRGAVATHRTAAHLDGLADEEPAQIEVSVPADRRVAGKIEGTRVYHAHRLQQARHPTRTPPRTRIDETVLDLVDRAGSPEEVCRWVTRACQRRLSTPKRLAAAAARRKKLAWRAELEALVADVAAGAHSPLEVRYLRRVERAHGLPAGNRQRRPAGRRVIWIDVDVDPYDVRVELDGRVGHVDEGAFRDRRRDNRGAREGKSTLRYGVPEVFGDPCGVAAEVADVLRARGWRGIPRPCGPGCRLAGASTAPVIVKS